MAQSISHGTDGFFRRGGERFVPVGVTYRRVAAAGAEKIRADLAAIAALGLNAVRVHSIGERTALEHAGEHGLAIFGDPVDFTSGVGLVEYSARPGTHAFAFDGLTDPFFHTFLPFAVKWERLRVPGVVVSLGAGVLLGARVQDAWLRAALPAALAAGAAGVFWNELHGPGGLLDAEGRVQAGCEALGEIAAGAATGVPVHQKPAIDLFVPAAENLDAGEKRRLLLAHYLLSSLGFPCRLTAHVADCRRLLVLGGPETVADAAALCSWVAQGGELFWHGPDLLDWNSDLETLLGARPIDWRSARGISVNAFGERFTMAHFPRDVRAELEPCGATVLATDQQGLPVLLENRVGRGRVRYVLPLVEEAIVPVAAHPTARDRWAAWYRGMLAP
jgi:hypothetical protein